MPVTDVVTLDGVQIESAPVLNRDCSFPIMDGRRYAPHDDVVNNMPVLIGSWENGATVPAITSQAVELDFTDATGECNSPVVMATMQTCRLLAPAMAEFDAKSPVLKYIDLIDEFCKQRGLVKNEQLRSLIDADGMPREGSPYYANYARFAWSNVAWALWAWLTRSAMIGDEAVGQDRIDGLYTQLTQGWAESADPCGNALNIRQTLDWGALTTASAGPYSAKSPDDVTVASKTVTFFGVTHDVPVGMNLAQFLEDMYFPLVESYTDQYGDVMWEMHVPTGKARCFLNTAACMQPCDKTNEYDPDARERFARLRNTKIAQLYPSGRMFPMMETRYVTGNTMWLGPREIGGNPTYALFFKNLNQYWGDLGLLGNTYGQGSGTAWDEPMISQQTTDYVNQQLNDVAFHYDVSKVPNSHKCVQYGAFAKAGVLAVSRHLWLQISNIACATFVTNPASELTITLPPPPEPEPEA
jgi:hypothetical protein